MNEIEEARPRIEVKRTQVLSYLAEFKEELKKVTWTTQSELIFCTKVVIGATFAFGLGIYLVDLLIKGALETVSALVRLIVC